MFDKKNLKIAMVGLGLMGASIILTSNSFADPCSSNISGNGNAGIVCSFESGVDSITINSGATLGGITQDNYNALSGSITNNGTISNELTYGIEIFNGSTLGLSLTNNGTISTTSSSGISVNGSTISNAITNSGSITIDDTDPAITITNSTINGSINNSGTIRNIAGSDSVFITTSTITGNFTNSGSIRGYLNGIELNNSSTISGNITNSGSITGDTTAGIKITNSSEVSGNLTNSGSISGDQDGIFLDGATISGSIINQAGGTISGNNSGINVSDSSSSITSINNYSTITGGTYAIYIEPSATVNSINLYEGSVITGAIDASNTTLNYYGGQINGSTNVNNFNITSGANFNMTHAITANSAVNNSGTLSTGTSTRTITGNYTQLSGGTLNISASTASNYGQISVTNNVDLSASGKINVNVLSNSNITAGQILSNVISAGGTFIPPTSYNITDNSYLLKFTASGSSSVNLTATSDASTSVAQGASVNGNNASAGAAQQLDRIISLNSSGDWQNVIGALNSLSSSQAVSDAVSQTTPALAGATNTALTETMNTAMRIIQARQDLNSGISSGDDFQTNRNVWIKSFGSWGDQKNKDGVIGYDSTSYGFIAGADKPVDDENHLGVGFSYFNSHLNSANNKVNVDSFLGIAYGSHNLDDKTEINGEVALGYNRNNSIRNINFSSINRTARGSYDGWNLHAGTGISRLIKIDKKHIIAPQFRLDYFVAGNKSYTENGAGSLNLHVNSQQQTQLIPAFEVKGNHQLNSKFSFALNAGLGYDLLNNRNNVSAYFENSDAAFTTRGFKPSPWILRSGFGFIYKQSDDVDFTIRYDRRDRGNYTNQTLSINVSKLF